MSMNSAEFREKQFDGPYEIIGIEVNNDGELIKGILYYPPKEYQKPYPIIVYFHGFPQLFPLAEIVKSYHYLLDEGYALLVFNFRGYRFSEGTVSLGSQLSDSIKIIEFCKALAHRGILDSSSINVIGEDFGAFISLLLIANVNLINKLLLLSPIINPYRHVHGDNFIKVIQYITHFLPGNIRGIENLEEFVDQAKNETEIAAYQVDNIVERMNFQSIKIIVGSDDKLTPISEIKSILK